MMCWLEMMVVVVMMMAMVMMATMTQTQWGVQRRTRAWATRSLDLLP